MRRDPVSAVCGVAAAVGAAVALWVDVTVHGVSAVAPGPSAAHAAVGRHPPLLRSLPLRIRIPDLAVDAPIDQLGLRPGGAIEAPSMAVANLAGWYRGGPSPGEAGAAVILGHRDAHRTAVFFELPRLAVGAKVEVTRSDGTIAVFSVQGTEQFPRAKFPSERVYAATDHAVLRLITCGGAFDRHRGEYVDNIVVSAALTAVRPVTPPRRRR